MNIKQVKALILDVDGVLWRNYEPIGELKDILSVFDKKGIAYCFATNNSSKSVSQNIEKLKSFQLHVNPDQIFTSGKATSEVLKERHPDGGEVFVVGMAGLIQTLKEFGFNNGASNPLAVVVGLDKNITYEKLRIASLFIRSGVPFIGTNADNSFPTPEGLIPGAGSLIAALEAASDTKAEIIGKPQPVMFYQALNYLKCAPEDVLVVGDRLETDIAGGQAAGCKTALVLSGVSTREMGEAWKPAPDLILPDLTQLAKMM